MLYSCNSFPVSVRPGETSVATQLEVECCHNNIIMHYAGVVLIASIASIIGLAAALTRKSAAKHSLCLTPECVELGNQVLSSLDESVNPCDDFYKFACNKYLKQAIIPFGGF